MKFCLALVSMGYNVSMCNCILKGRPGLQDSHLTCGFLYNGCHVGLHNGGHYPPPLDATFMDHFLQDMQTLSHPDVL